jgi:hypothetical protein
MKIEESETQPGKPVGIWIEQFGAEAGAAEQAQSEESTTSFDPRGYFRQHPELMKRYFPQFYRESMSAAQDSTTADSSRTTASSNNNPVIDVKIRALNLERSGQNTGANGQFAFEVEEIFKTNQLFEASGTKLIDIQQSEANADTFTFGLKVQLKNGMKRM